MGIEERWQRRQKEIVTDAGAREAEKVRRHNDRVEEVHQRLVRAARQAFERGDGWFEAEIPQRTVGSLNHYFLSQIKRDHPSVSHPPRGDLLSRIEDEGWKLHTAQYLYVQLGEESRGKLLSSGQQVKAKGEIIGVYLFQRA
ncbi:hypothetical protein [Streptomyces cellulosae]|uniref:hypothetical protein n=1 Tax=Streptomyces cellulosae TaxID=1968 RepID=UPI0004C80E5A|nr:hypothetical protein [Streptomyces cellulosae]